MSTQKAFDLLMLVDWVDIIHSELLVADCLHSSVVHLLLTL